MCTVHECLSISRDLGFHSKGEKIAGGREGGGRSWLIWQWLMHVGILRRGKVPVPETALAVHVDDGGRYITTYGLFSPSSQVLKDFMAKCRCPPGFRDFGGGDRWVGDHDDGEAGRHSVALSYKLTSHARSSRFFCMAWSSCHPPHLMRRHLCWPPLGFVVGVVREPATYYFVCDGIWPLGGRYYGVLLEEIQLNSPQARYACGPQRTNTTTTIWRGCLGIVLPSHNVFGHDCRTAGGLVLPR